MREKRNGFGMFFLIIAAKRIRQMHARIFDDKYASHAVTFITQQIKNGYNIGNNENHAFPPDKPL
jgi:hypothetical protein